jgi:hypothetical protein
MGSVAFLVLMSAEFGLGTVFGRSLGDQLAAYGSSPGAIGLGAQVIFAMFPVIQGWLRQATFGKGRGSPNSGAFQYKGPSTNSVAEIPSVRDSDSPTPTHLGLGQESSGVRAPQYKISHLAESRWRGSRRGTNGSNPFPSSGGPVTRLRLMSGCLSDGLDRSCTADGPCLIPGAIAIDMPIHAVKDYLNFR